MQNIDNVIDLQPKTVEIVCGMILGLTCLIIVFALHTLWSTLSLYLFLSYTIGLTSLARSVEQLKFRLRIKYMLKNIEKNAEQNGCRNAPRPTP